MDIDLDTQTLEILLAATNHDVASLKPFLRTPGAASVQDQETGQTPLHAAIAACGPSSAVLPNGVTNGTSNGGAGEEVDESIDMEKAKDTLKELFLSGAIWNDLDFNDETPGCLAWRLGQKELYDMVVEAGVRAEMLLNLMGGYQQLEDSEEEEDEDEDKTADSLATDAPSADSEVPQSNTQPLDTQSKADVNSADYLASDVRFADDKLLDADANGVMMAWETDIMRQSCNLLAPTSGLRILNVGFGMGIIDRMFAATQPASHHIIEAHPAVLANIESSDFGKEWEEKGNGKFVIHKGKWQDVVPSLLENGEVFDAIYFDTFGEDYSQLKDFFSEYVVGLLDPAGKFGFFNGLGADRRVCYDVYCKVVELDLCDAGFDTEWEEVDVDAGKDGEGEWEGVRRRYWTLDKYRLPICTFMG